MTGLQDVLRASFRVWVFSALGLLIPGLLGWINAVTEWARSEGATPFPDAHGLVFIFVAAITAAFPAAVAGLVRFLENASGRSFLPRAAGPRTVPMPGPGERGAVSWLVIVGVAVLVALVILVTR